MAEERPAYYRLYADAWDEINGSLPKAQAAKLLYAMAAFFFDGVEPDDGELPKPVRALFNIQRSQIANYRKNALNGRKAGQRPDRKLSETSQLFDQLSDQEVMQEIEAPHTQQPAKTQNLGTKPPAKGPAKGPANTINHKSVIQIKNPPPTNPFKYGSDDWVDFELERLRTSSKGEGKEKE